MRKIILTKGLPGSGKTTWAKEYQKKNPNTVLVSKDDLRSLLHNGVHSKGREDFVLNIRDAIVIRALEQGQEVIVHDTNFNPVHEAQMHRIAEMLPWKGQCEVVIQDFTDVPIEVCMERDLKRPSSVGEKVIRTMYNQYLRPKPTAPESVAYDPALPQCCLVDLDGSLALFGDANPYDRDFLKDTANPAITKILQWKDYAEGEDYGPPTAVILFSGRSGKFRPQTEQWLKQNGIGYQALHMRKADDTRKDSIIKKELYEEHIKGKYNVLFVIDDRKQVKHMWVENGLFVFDVNQYDEEF